MAGSLNKAMIIGNLGQDPEIRRTQDGRPIGNMSIATSESWRDKNTGERQERTQWHRVVVFNEGICKVLEQYLKKGDKVYIEGQIETRKWQDQTGQERYSTEIVLRPYNGTLTMLSSRDNDRGGRSDGYGSNRGSYGGDTRPNGGSGRSPEPEPFDDDIPF